MKIWKIKRRVFPLQKNKKNNKKRNAINQRFLFPFRWAKKNNNKKTRSIFTKRKKKILSWNLKEKKNPKVSFLSVEWIYFIFFFFFVLIIFWKGIN